MFKRIQCFIVASCLFCSLLIGGCGKKSDASLSDSSSSFSSSSVQEKCSLSLFRSNYSVVDGQNVTLQIEFTVDGRSADLGLLTVESDNESVATVNN